MVVLILDTREHALSAELTRIGIPFQTAMLDVGDILIQSDEGDPLLVIERKTHADFAASLTDGRYREQRTRLMATRGQGIATMYLLEGTWSPKVDRMFHSTSEVQLQRLTTRLIMRYGMHVLTSTCLQETAQWCGRMFAQLAAEADVFHPKALAAEVAGAMTTYTTTFSAVKKNNKDPGGVAVSMLSAVPGLGGKRVLGLLEQTSIADLVSMTAEEIGAIVVGERRLGANVGLAVYGALHANLKHT